MLIRSERLGTVKATADQVFLFPDGLVGMPRIRQWALLSDSDHPSLAWLQSTARAEICLPVVSPRLYFPDYRARIAGRDLEVLRLRAGSETFILTTVSLWDGRLTTNLRAPIILNAGDGLGAQLTTSDAQPIRRPLPMESSVLSNDRVRAA